MNTPTLIATALRLLSDYGTEKTGEIPGHLVDEWDNMLDELFHIASDMDKISESTKET